MLLLFAAFVLEAAGLAVVVAVVAAGEAAGLELAAGLDAGVADEAGRLPAGRRLLRAVELLSMSCARLFVIFASRMATSSIAAFRICLRWLRMLSVASLRTSGLSSVKFSLCKRRSVSLKIVQRPLA